MVSYFSFTVKLHAGIYKLVDFLYNIEVNKTLCGATCAREVHRMQAENFSLSWLDDPRVFAVNRLRPYSDHAVYANAKEAQSGASSLKRSLSGE